jgi:5-formyltetrahydrofolate cyclo-ligase
MTKDTDTPAGFASPPCFAHELELSDSGYVAVDPVEATDVARWRKAERERLITARLAVPVAERKRVAEEISGELDGLIESRPSIIVSLYWPFRGELDLRGWMRVAHQRGARIALPIVEAKGHPLTAIPTIYPQPHDIPMDVIVTGAGRVTRRLQTK